MRGLDALERDQLEGAHHPDPCDPETDCEPESPEELAAIARLVARGLVVVVPCVWWPDDTHPELTSLGRLALVCDRAVRQLQ